MKHFTLILSVILLAHCSGKTDLTAPQSFKGCDDVQKFVSDSWSKWNPGGAASGGASPQTNATGGGGDGNSHLNLQEAGVDESDMLRIEDHLIFIGHLGGVEIIKRNSLQKIGFVNTERYRRTRLFTTPSRLIIVGSLDMNSTGVQIYQLSGNSLPKLLSESAFKGQYMDSRRIGERLVVVMADPNTINYSTVNSPIVQLDGDDQISGVKCSCIQPPPDFTPNFLLTKAASMNIEKPEEPPHLVGFLGGADQVYMSMKNLYVGGRFWSEAKTRIVKVGVDTSNGELSLRATGHVKGTIKDRWAFKEFSNDESLGVVVTTGGWNGMIFEDQSNRYETLVESGAKLESVAKTESFGLHEDIRAVRYVGNTAYAVTFEKTDPLFAIDLSNPRDPKLLGELVVPGFSAYLHPFKNGRLIGVGFDAKDMGNFSWFQGVQISLFDTKNPMDLKRLDNKIIGVRGSYSDPTNDAHAFYSDPERNRIGVPVVQLEGPVPNGWEYGNELAFSGAIVYEVGNTLQETARLTHTSYIPAACKTLMSRGQWWQDQNPSYDINRLVPVDGQLLSVSRFALVAHCLQDPKQETGRVIFSGSDEEKGCQANLAPPIKPD